jgi:hypothetical protein
MSLIGHHMVVGPFATHDATWSGQQGHLVLHGKQWSNICAGPATTVAVHKLAPHVQQMLAALDNICRHRDQPSAHTPILMPFCTFLSLTLPLRCNFSLSLHRPAAKTSKGCGTVQFAHAESAIAARHALSGSRSLPRADAALVVEALDPRRQKSAPPGELPLNTSNAIP